MRILLDTNILIHREAATIVHGEVGKLFFWLDKLKHTKCVHPISAEEIGKHGDDRVRRTFQTKLEAYHLLKTTAPLSPEALRVGNQDKSDNDRNDTLIVNELHAGRVDFLISEDRGIHAKAAALGIADRTFKIESFLEKAVAENPELVDYRVLSVRKVVFGTVEVKTPFFDSFRADYGNPFFNSWFNRKADEPAYVCYEGSELVAFLYLKVEDSDENYSDIEPRLAPKKRLKIGTFKVELNGYKLGERFLKIVLDNALRQRVDEIYVTIFPRTIGQQRLAELLQEFGFSNYGIKTSDWGTEAVYVRDMRPDFSELDPKLTFPFVKRTARTFLVPIYPEYHTSLLPDSILRTESPIDFIEQEPHRNAIRKVYVSRGKFRDLRSGDTLVFYRTGGYHKSVVTSLGVVDGIYRNQMTEEQFVERCRKRSVFSDDELRKLWNHNPKYRPFIVGFLYAYAFPKRPTLKELIANGVIRDVESAPRGFEQIAGDKFATILRLAGADQSTIVD